LYLYSGPVNAVRPPIRPPALPASRWQSPVVDGILAVLVLGLLLVQIVVFSYCAACFDSYFNAGQWLDVGAAIFIITVLPLCGVCCFALAMVLYRRQTLRPFAVGALTIAFALGCPPVAWPLAHGLSLQAAIFWQPVMRMTQERQGGRIPMKVAPSAEAAARQYETLLARFRKPQKVARVENGLIVLEDGTVLSLYGIARSEKMRATLKQCEGELVRSRQVLVRLPPEPAMFMKEYSPDPPGAPYTRGDAEPVAHSPKDALGWRYDAVPSLVTVDGQLLNSRFQ
jgi:hypothetical protein